MHLDLPELIKATGYIGMFVIVFVESGLLVGFFLPGDSLLFTAGFLASQGFFDIAAVIGLIFIAAVLGDSVGYTIGRRAGPKVFRKKDSIIFSHNHIERSRAFYAKHGGKTIVIARFVPVVRTFAPVLAGVGKMPYRTFLFFNVFGAFVWSFGVTLLGYYLGKSIPDIDKYLLPIIAIIVLISALPSLIHLLKDEERRAKLKESSKQAWHKTKAKIKRRPAK